MQKDAEVIRNFRQHKFSSNHSRRQIVLIIMTSVCKQILVRLAYWTLHYIII